MSCASRSMQAHRVVFLLEMQHHHQIDNFQVEQREACTEQYTEQCRCKRLYRKTWIRYTDALRRGSQEMLFSVQCNAEYILNLSRIMPVTFQFSSIPSILSVLSDFVWKQLPWNPHFNWARLFLILDCSSFFLSTPHLNIFFSPSLLFEFFS